MLGKSSVLLLLEVSLKGRALPPIRYSHAGICPNDMNPNLWVDAQSTCKRECEADLVSDAHLCLSAFRGSGGTFCPSWRGTGTRQDPMQTANV